MTEREKIIEIIKRNGTYNGRSLSFDYYVIQPDDLADALIAAGIGDTTNLIVENESCKGRCAVWRNYVQKVQSIICKAMKL